MALDLFIDRLCRCVVSLFTVLLIACQGAQSASVEQIRGSTASRLPLRLQACTGLREGYTVHGTFRFVRDPSGNPITGIVPPESLIVQIEAEPGVPTRFISGTFRLYTKEGPLQGTVSAPSLTFLGGQGGRPSLGGTFLLKANQGDSYKVSLPPTELARE
ncbi:MAG: hypothetical protein HY710_05350 [Candidatus Latescibacteria bacterium]|nr:hypothetical protein [Candidatus Latescibacterota bacterium]